MRTPSQHVFSRALCASLAAAGLALAAAPTLAQTVDELTVTGRLGPDGEVKSLSRTVGYGDLDLTTRAGADVLMSRIKDTARALCSELGESPVSTGVAPSCDRAAIDDAQKQARMAIAAATPRDMPALAAATDASTSSDASAITSDDYAADTSVNTVSAAPSYLTTTVTNGPVADTPENRARFGGPLSHAGRSTAPAGN